MRFGRIAVVTLIVGVAGATAFLPTPRHAHLHAATVAEPQDQTFNLRRTYQDSLDNLDAIKELEGKIRCTCGCNLDVHTCRTTDFTCATSPAMHAQVLRRWEQGQSAEEIVAAFVAEHGEYVLMAPPKEGFNWAGYLMPVVGLMVGVLIIWSFMSRQRELSHAAAGVVDDAPPDAQDADHNEDDLAKLQRELDRYEV